MDDSPRAEVPLSREQRLSAATRRRLAGDAAAAVRLYRDLLRENPADAEVIYRLGVIAADAGQGEQAERLLALAVRLAPDHPAMRTALGATLRALGRRDEARDHLTQAAALQPDRVETHLHLGRLLLECGCAAEGEAHLREATRLQSERFPDPLDSDPVPPEAARWNRLEVSVRRRLADCAQGAVPLVEPDSDALFLHGEEAWEQARLGREFPLNHGIRVRQGCYHPGPSWPDAPETLLALPEAGELADFFLQTRRRRPARVIFDPSRPDEATRALDWAQRLDGVYAAFIARQNALLEPCRALVPEFRPGEPLRIFLLGSRYTTVIRPALENMTAAFRRQGCEVFLSMEGEDLSLYENVHHMEDYLAFRPHVCFKINHVGAIWQHPSVFNAVWWQDPMDELLGRDPVTWRGAGREFNYLYVREFAPYLE
ncbi:MAG: tetratricopeptide repeat protein, partial [Magnetococcales bacterium]|nr:tetratricopeptide repeat protein [Magnetococcales bacterium]